MVIEPEEQRKQIASVFEFVKAWHARGASVAADWRRSEWRLSFTDLPAYPTIDSPTSTPESEAPYALRVRRPDQTQCPALPEELDQWMMPSWRDPFSDIQILETRNILVEDDPVTIKFADDPSLQETLDSWATRRSEWQSAEIPARRAGSLFDRLFELRGRLKREGERVCLFLADGVVRAAGSQGPVLYPIFLQRAELLFDAQEPSFTVVVDDSAPELNSALIRTIDRLDAKSLGDLRLQFQQGGFDILNPKSIRETLSEYLNTLFPNAQILESPDSPAAPDRVHAWQQRLLLLVPRSARVADAVDSILKRLTSGEAIPGPLKGILGLDEDEDEDKHDDGFGERQSDGGFGSSSHRPTGGARAGDRFDPREARRAFLLTKPANKAQQQILVSVATGKGVVVKGPPGTGKTHTIANILGHFLSQGLKTLVVSHTSKALRVLRDQMPAELRPLCVSLLDSDSESRRELEESVLGITSRLSTSDKHALRAQAQRLEREREQVLNELEQSEQTLRDAIAAEYLNIVIDGKSITPTAAARRIPELGEQHAWIPCPVRIDAPCSLSSEEVDELYRLNQAVTPDEEESLRGSLPNIDAIPTPDQFRAMLAEETQDELVGSTVPAGVWRVNNNASEATVEQARVALHDAIKILRASRKQVHLLECMDCGRRGGPKAEVWRSLIANIRDLASKIESHEAHAQSKGALVSPELCNESMQDACKEIQESLGKSGQFFRLAAAVSFKLRPSWSRLLNGCTVAQRRPTNAADFSAVESRIAVHVLRDELQRTWRSFMYEFADLKDGELGGRPEDTLRQHADQIELALRWNEDAWRPSLKDIESVGIDFAESLRRIQPQAGRFAELERIVRAIETLVLPALREKRIELSRQRATSALEELAADLAGMPASADLSGLARSAAKAVRERDSNVYEATYQYLSHLLRQSTAVARRADLLTRLRKTAPDWARAIQSRSPIHCGPTPPGRFDDAWQHAQLSSALAERAAVSAPAAQAAVSDLRKRLSEKTTELVESRAWAAQFERIRHSEMQALEGWLTTVNQRGFDSGKRSSQLKSQARRLLMQARRSVPVWIMTTPRAIDSLDYSTQAFDVVIIDEASQSNLMGLLPLSLANSAIVVGDDKQVSPISVSENLDETQKLIDEHLQGLKTCQLFTGRFSIYDFASQAFRGRHLLTEHFRCAQDIIQFSNQFYDGKIQPLRDCSAVKRRPHVVEHRVAAGTCEGKVNEREAEEIASLLVACMDQPEYEGASFGVITMLGQGEQSVLIDQILHTHLSEARYEAARILCGTAPQFQGDERDVVFLSIVSSSGDGPLVRRRDSDSEKRFNVAASRARDQLWVVHSIDDQDLKEDDLRLRLIRHARDASAASRQIEAINRAADSEFERRVGKDLTDRGFKVVPQWPVGSLRIDLVVVGSDNARAAVECDGGAFHGIEKLDEDLERQQVLERLGWRFVRIRGTEYFRSPQATIAEVTRQLETIGVTPIGSSSEEIAKEQQGESLLERIRRRAADLRDRWRQDEPETEEVMQGNQMNDVAPVSEGDSSLVVDQDAMQTSGFRLVIDRPEKWNGGSTSSVEDEVFDCIREAERPISRGEILERTGVPLERWTKAISQLVSSGRVMRLGDKRGAKYVLPPPTDRPLPS